MKGRNNAKGVHHQWTGEEINTFSGHTNRVTCVAFSHDGKYVVSGAMDNTVRMWDVSTGKQIRIFNGHSDTVSVVRFSPDGKHIVSGSYDTTLRLWEGSSGKEKFRFIGHSNKVYSAEISPNGKYVLSGDDKILNLWDIGKGQQIALFHVADLP